jgi:DNA anti-recombination protein RmuC
MNKMIILAISAAVFVGCKPANDRVPRAEGSSDARTETPARPAEAERSTTQQKLSSQLDDLDAKMADLKARAQRAGDQAKAEWEARRPQLEAQRDAAAKKLEELKQSSKESWSETSRKAEAAFEELEKGFKEAWAKLKE